MRTGKKQVIKVTNPDWDILHETRLNVNINAYILSLHTVNSWTSFCEQLSSDPSCPAHHKPVQKSRNTPHTPNQKTSKEGKKKKCVNH